MVNFGTIGLATSKLVGRTGFILNKYSPEILMGLGIIGAVTSTVLACRATLKINSVIEVANKDIEKIKFVREQIKDEEVFPKQEYVQELTVAYVQKAINIGKLYAVPVAVGAVSIGCLLGSHHILNTRSAAFLGAYKMIDEAFKSYRQRVVNAIGPEKESLIRMGVKEETQTDVVADENGKKTKVKKVIQTPDGVKPEDYTRVFAKGNPYWQHNLMLNEAFLKSKENYFNGIGRAHV